MENKTENSPEVDKGKKRQKNMEFRGSFFSHVFALFSPLSTRGPFSISFSIFLPPISGFWLSSMPCQPGMIPNLAFLFLQSSGYVGRFSIL